MQITTGTHERAQRVIIYGPEGIGKSTLAARGPDPLFFDLEAGTDHLNVARAQINNWEGLLEGVAWYRDSEHNYQTLVIDTIDAAEVLAQQFVCLKHSKAGIEDFGFGKGYKYVSEAMILLLSALDQIIDAGSNVILLAHSHLKKVERPEESGAFDRYELKMHKLCSAAVKEWADAVLFCNYETHVVEVDGTKKAKGGRRVIHSSHHPVWDAKNRHGLAETLPLDFESIKGVLFNNRLANVLITEQTVDLAQELAKLMIQHHITEQEMQAVNALRGYYAAEVPVSAYSSEHLSKLISQIDAVKGLIESDIRKNKNEEEGQ